MNYDYIFAFDPSGSFSEGKGITGWVLMNANEELLERGYINARDYTCPEAYWNAHLDLIKKYNRLYYDRLIIVIEEYVLYKDRSRNQINSKMETCRLIGVMQWQCWRLKQPYSMQLAATVKPRWTDDLLVHEKILRRDGNRLIDIKSGLSVSLEHTRDAYRHALHYAVCRNAEPKKIKIYRKRSYSNYDTNLNDNYYED